nr:uncharacterized protein LOC111423303 [Onthophagus taurus]
MWQLEKIKEQKRFEFLEIERQNDLMQKQELELANAMKIDKKKLLEDITEQQNKLDHQLIKIHNEREIDRFRLMEQLHDVEENADVAINKLLTSNREPLAYLIEQEQVFEEKMLQAALESNSQLLCKQDILSAMQELIEYETAKFQEFSSNKNEITRSILEEELKNNQHLTDLLESQNLRQSELVDTLQNDSELQKAAVGTLLEKSDARIWGLVQQVRLVESQLAALTSIELDRKKLKIDKQIVSLLKVRMGISKRTTTSFVIQHININIRYYWQAIITLLINFNIKKQINKNLKYTYKNSKLSSSKSRTNTRNIRLFSPLTVLGKFQNP